MPNIKVILSVRKIMEKFNLPVDRFESMTIGNENYFFVNKDAYVKLEFKAIKQEED